MNIALHRWACLGLFVKEAKWTDRGHEILIQGTSSEMRSSERNTDTLFFFFEFIERNRLLMLIKIRKAL